MWRHLLSAGYTCATVLTVAQAPLCVDPSFQAPFTQIVVADIDFMPNGQILVGGQMKPQGSISTLAWSRLNPDGSVDPGFNQTIGPSGSAVRIWDEQYFFATAGIGVLRCFLSDGMPDPSYQYPDLFFNGAGNNFHNFPDDKQWRTGWWSKRLYDEEGNQIGSEPGYGLIQRLPNGLVDPDFDHKFTAPGWLTSIRETPDGRFLLGSAGGTQYEGQPVGRILRVWPDARLDTTFQSSIFWAPNTGDYYFYPDGRMLAFGMFQAPEYPDDTLAIMRLHPDGSTDTTWPAIHFRNPQYFFPGLARISGVLEFEPGKLIIVGEFTTINGQPAGAIAAIDTAGNVLWDYFTGSDLGVLQLSNGSTQRYLQGIEQAPDGSIYIYGSYHGFDDGCSNHPDQRMITRLYPLHVGVGERTSDRAIQVYPNPSHGLFQLSAPQPWPLTVLDMHGSEVLRLPPYSREIDLTTQPPGVYTAVLQTPQGRWIQRMVVVR
ncbi:MAG: T9SS type A sorting domain-containing protein [Flavobacteriales bacterium]|jgi:hypothetical protein|nr:T9SS type A sorting domain-containing protein [Flavobacteriales bacterium]